MSNLDKDDLAVMYEIEQMDKIPNNNPKQHKFEPINLIAEENEVENQVTLTPSMNASPDSRINRQQNMNKFCLNQ